METGSRSSSRSKSAKITEQRVLGWIAADEAKTPDVDMNIAHDDALTRVNFRDPKDSNLVVRMAIDRHNCFAGDCAIAGEKMLAAVTAWRDALPQICGQ